MAQGLITLEKLKAYLIAKGWQRGVSHNEALDLFQLPLPFDSRPFNLYVPSDNNYIGIQNEIGSTLAIVADILGLSVPEVASEVIGASGFSGVEGLFPKNSLLGELELIEAYSGQNSPSIFSCRRRSGQIYIGMLASKTQEVSSYLYLPVSHRRFQELEANVIDLNRAYRGAEDGQVLIVHIFKDSTSRIGTISVPTISEDLLPPVGLYLAHADSDAQSSQPSKKELISSDLIGSRILTKRQVNNGLPLAARVGNFMVSICRAMRHSVEYEKKLGNIIGSFREPLAALPTFGSYEINILSPLPAQELESGNRKGLERLMLGLIDVERATNDNDHKVISDNSEQGLSREMCIDVISALEELDDDDVEFTVAWSTESPVINPALTNPRIRVGPSSLNVLKAARDALTLVPPTPVTVVAEVIDLLHHQKARIKFNALEQQGQRAYVELIGEYHEIATSGYNMRHPILISGMMYKSGTLCFIEEVTAVKLLTEITLPESKPKRKGFNRKVDRSDGLQAESSGDLTKKHNRKFPSIMIYLRKAVQQKEVSEEFTQSDFLKWVAKRNIQRRDKQRPYKLSSLNATLNTHVRGYNTSARGREIGELERFFKVINGKRIMHYRFIDLWKYIDSDLP